MQSVSYFLYSQEGWEFTENRNALYQNREYVNREPLQITAAYVFDEIAGGIKDEADFNIAAAFDVEAAFDVKADFNIGEADAI